jgi:tetratricopeptide (TPR) repeat protein
MDAKSRLFISRAGADEAFSTEIVRVLEADGHEVIVQQRDFPNTNFLNEMDEALASGARIVGLLSAEYLTSKYCRAEWLNALAGDPLNENGRLILLRVAECEPAGLLSGIAYWDLLTVRDDRALVGEVVRNAVREGGRRDLAPVAGPYWRAPRTIVELDAVRETASFTGREAELGAVEAALWNGRGIAAIHGLGGTGKSVLAREYARRNAGRYSVVWRLHAQTENGVIDGLLRLGERLAPGLETSQDRRAAAQEVTTTVLSGFDKPVLFVFDNLEDEGLLRIWRPRAQSHLIATSRTTGWGSDVALIRLDSWPVPDAVSYLRRESGRDDADLSVAEAQKIADALGSLPLALSHAAAYLKRTKTVTASRYLARINDHLSTAPKGAEYDRTVFATFREAIAKAEEEAPGACALLCLCSFFAPDAIPEELCHQDFELGTGLSPALGSDPVMDLRTTLSDPARVDEALGALDRLSLVTFAPQTRTFTMHRLVQAAARTLLASGELWAVAAVVIANAAFPAVEYRTWPICERLLPHALATLAAIPVTYAFSHEVYLANCCARYLVERAEYAAAESLARRALAAGERSFGPNTPEIAMLLVTLCDVLRARNKLFEVGALYRRALEIAETHFGRDHLETSTYLNNLATFFMAAKNYAEAEPLMRRSLAIDETHRGPADPVVATRLGNLAHVLASTGHLPEAEQLCRRALAIDENAYGNDHPSVATRLNNLSVYLSRLGRIGEARTAVRRALDINETSYGPSHPTVALRLRNLAGILDGTDPERESHLRRALSIDEATFGPHHPAIVDDLVMLAAVARLHERVEEANALDQRARAMADSIGDAAAS